MIEEETDSTLNENMAIWMPLLIAAGYHIRSKEEAKEVLQDMGDDEKQELAKNLAKKAMEDLEAAENKDWQTVAATGDEEDNIKRSQHRHTTIPLDKNWRSTKEMKITQEDLRRIIVEEYIAEEALDEDNVDDLLDWIKGGEKPEWAGDKTSSPGLPPKVPPTASDETYVMDRPPGDDAPESEYQGFQNDSGPDLTDAIGEIVHGKEPEEIAEIFDVVYKSLTHPAVVPIVQLVQGQDPDEIGKTFDAIFTQLSGQEEPEEEPPETLYVKGAEGRPAAGFKLEELQKLIREVLSEYHDDDLYDLTAGDYPPPHSTQAEPSNKEKLEQVYQLLDDAVGEYSPDTHEYSVLKSALDGVTNILDGLDTGDNMARADENLTDV